MELACNYVAFEKGNQVIKRVKFTSKDADMIDNPDIFQIEHSVLFGSQDRKTLGARAIQFRSQSARIIPGRI